MKWIDVNERTTDTVKYIYIYKGYRPVGPLIISYHHDMRVNMIISALTNYHCNRVHIDIMVLDNIDKKDKKKLK